jgi:protein-arginine kinase activator protein McsA
MFGRNFNKLFNELFNDLEMDFFNPENFERKTFTSDDGSFSYTMYVNKRNGINTPSEISLLKKELDNAVEEQNFEKAVELRDKIKNLEQNVEKISKLQKELDESIKIQDFEKAIELRDKINSLK